MEQTIEYDGMGGIHHLRVIRSQSWRVWQIYHNPSKIGLKSKDFQKDEHRGFKDTTQKQERTIFL